MALAGDFGLLDSGFTADRALLASGQAGFGTGSFLTGDDFLGMA